MKKIKLLAGLLLCLSVMPGIISCAKYQQASALTTYINQDILGINELEIQAFRHYTAVSGQNYTSNDAVYQTLKTDVIPTYERFLFLLKKIDPPNEEIRQLHRIYVRGAEILCDGLKSKMIGLEKHDPNHIRQAEAEILKGFKETFKWRDKLVMLCQRYDIRQAKREGSRGLMSVIFK